MGLLWIILIFCLIILFLGAVIYLCYVTGIFYGVVVRTGRPPIGKVVIAYKFARGSFKGCGPLFGELYSIIPPTYRTLGIYYDDPKKVEESKLRYAISAILSENDSPIDQQVQKKLLDAGYKLFTLPEVKHAVTSHFPDRSSLTLYGVIARVYPKIDKYIEEHKLDAHPFLEIYDGFTWQFMGVLDRHDKFYLPEATSG